MKELYFISNKTSKANNQSLLSNLINNIKIDNFYSKLVISDLQIQ